MNEQKRPYLKPELTQVLLRPEEAVLTACKLASTGGGGPGGPPHCVLAASCFVTAS